MQTKQEKLWAMLIHFSQFTGFMVPFFGLIVPIIIWQIKKHDSTYIDAHGKVVGNWILSLIIYGLVCYMLAFIGIGFLLLVALMIVSLIFTIIGGIKANDGVVWNYPMSIKFFK